MYEHVDHELTREVLQMQRIDNDSVVQALTFAYECLIDDLDNEDVSFEVYIIRNVAYDDAEFQWQEGDIEGTILALRRFWEE
jgi:hypothetical protein